MKKYFEYIGLLAFTLFSFYYTDKITTLMNKKDPVMKSILEYKEKNSTNCKEGYITSDGVVLGLSGREVNEKESYSKMQGSEFNPELMVFDEITCKVNKENTKDNFIINASPALNKISIFIHINDMKYIDKILEKVKEKNIKINLIVNGELLNNNKDYFKLLQSGGYELIYSGKSEKDFEIYTNLVNKANQYCISINNQELEMCKNNNITRLKTNYYYSKDILTNTKNNLEKGSFYIYKENKNTLDEISSTINYIKGKNIEISSISNILN